ncbi:hypothetical protein, partial [Acetobacter aceti]
DNRNKASEMITELGQIQDAVRSLCPYNTCQANTDMVAPLVKSGLLPARWVQNDTIVDPYKTPIVSIDYVKTTAGYQIGYMIQIHNVEECIKIYNYLDETQVSFATFKKMFSDPSKIENTMCGPYRYPMEMGFQTDS